ncbi:MAG: M56 family metallopeptidase [Balneolaceae bacterium]|jgi:TonB family protein
MIEFNHILKNFGGLLLEHFWFPLFIWTVIAVPITAILHNSDRFPPVYQYHSRVALLLTLPAGILGSYLTSLISKLNHSAEIAAAKFIVIQNPITVSPASPRQSLGAMLTDPMFLIGISGFLLVAGSVFLLFKMLQNMLHLKNLEHHLKFIPISGLTDLNLTGDTSLIAFSKDTQIPFTYGWPGTKIVIPADLQKNPKALAMAVQHELMHIKHRDFLLNGILTIVRAFFWVHPLAHYLYKSSQEYREITCDGEVLASNEFSKKQYASLLYTLAEREHKTTLAMSMAVKPSTLKKRIQLMSDQNTFTTKFRTSFLLTLLFACLVVITMACSDMQENGITNTELKQAQSEMQQRSHGTKLLYIVNGENWENSKPNISKLSRLKTKYIKSINVLKGKKAIDKYGQSGKNGVIEMEILNPAKAFSDLLSDEELNLEKNKDTEQDNDFYVAVEKMPELVGGLAPLAKKINYPKEAKENNVEGRVIVQFIVNEQGGVEDPQIIRGIGSGCDKEALRVIKQAQFKPGRQRGKAVRVQYSLPIVYRLPSEKQDS